MAAPRATGSRLRSLARRASAPVPEILGARAPSAPQDAEVDEGCCELCGGPIPSTHRHLLELSSRELVCACRPCSLLFDRAGAGGGRYRLIPERRLRLEDFALDELAWEELRVPVEMAFFFHSSAAGRVLAYYPGAMGAVESQLRLDSWRELERANPILAELEPDVEALLVNRTGASGGYWLVPLDDCYDLTGLIRMRWKGLAGGKEVWREIERFFAELDRRARPRARATSPSRGQHDPTVAPGARQKGAPEWAT